MATIDPVIVKLQADVSDLQKGLEQANGYLKGLDDQVKKADSAFAGMTTRMKQLGATIGITFGASQIVSFFKESVAASLEAEVAQQRLSSILKITNNTTDAQIQALNNQAKALGQVGVASADNITVLQSQLATFDLSAAAIGKLTPSIVDYVEAEKLGKATTEDFKNMTNSLAQALQGNFASLTKSGFILDEHTKKQISSGTEMERAEALTRVLNSTYEDMNKILGDTTEGALIKAGNKFNDLKQQIGDGLKPTVETFANFLSDTLIPALSKLTTFLTENKDTIIAVTKVLFAGVAAYTAYKVAIAVTTAASTVFQVATTLLKGAQLASIASTNGLAASTLALNAAIKANPIGAFITVATIAVGVIVALWKNSETFRNIVITAGKAALQAFAAIVPMVATVFEAIMKVVTGPMRLFLGALSKLPGVGKFAKEGLNLINTGLNSISDLGVKAAAKADALSKKLDALGKAAKKAKEEVVGATEGGGGFGKGREDKGGGVDEKTQKKVDALKAKLQKYYKEFAEVQKDAQDKYNEALDAFNERVLEAHERFRERELELTERYNEEMQAAQERYDEGVKAAYERRDEKVAEARKDFAKRMIDITKDFNKKEKELADRLAEQKAELERAAEDKRMDARRKAADREASLVQESMNRLRSAFASGLGISLKEEFEKGQGVKGIVDALRNQLTGARELQKNAAALAGKGYSQTFIEQIVKEGPKVGNEMAKALLEASPEATAEMQNLYTSLETITGTGLDQLAVTMNQGGNLATAELRKAYQQVSKDLVQDLAVIDKELQEGLMQAQKEYNEAVAANIKDRDEKIAEATEKLNEAIAEAEKELQKTLGELQAELAKAQVEAKKRFDKGIADAKKDLEKALVDAQKAFEKAIDEINKRMMERLNELQAEIQATINAIAQLIGAAAALGIAGVTPGMPAPFPITPPGGGGGGGGLNPYGGQDAAYDINNNITINQTSMTSPLDTANSVLYAIQYGQVIQVTPGTVTSGMYAQQGVQYAQ